MPLSIADLQTLDRLVGEALDQPPEYRGEWIDSLPAGLAHWAPLIRDNLAEDDGVLAALPAMPADRDPRRAGDTVGPWRLIRLLGEGGMSSVWLAERTDDVKRQVALKLPHRHLPDRGLAQRMRRERDILAGLNHDHIARLYEAGIDAEGQPYLALEYVLGEPINRYVQARKLTLRGRVALMVQAARAVAHAHANLVVHRDLKPANMLVSADGQVKLLDFGIAKLLEGDEAGAPSELTRVLGRALTPDYASPEQLLDEPVTTASDIYSLGVVLYEVLTGHKPYQVKRTTTLADTILHADIARPSKRADDDGRRIAGDLDAIVMKTLKREPAARYATMSALADDLDRWLAGQPVMAQPDSVAYRLRRFVARHAIGVSAVSAVAVALVAGIGIALWQAREARLEAAKSSAVKDFLLSILSAASGDQQDAQQRRKQPIGDVLLDAARSMPGRFAGQPEVRSEVQAVLGDVLGSLQMTESARPILEARLAELNARGAPLLERMHAQVALAVNLADTADFKRTPVMLQEVINQLEGRRDAPSRLLMAEALRDLSMSKVQRYDGTSGVEDAARAVAIAAVEAPGRKAHASSLSMLGFAHAYRQNMPAADAAFREALALAEKLPPAERAYEADIRLRYGEGLMVGRYHERALVELRQGLKVIEQSSGTDSFRWARTALLVANLTALTGDPPAAIALFEQVLKVYAKFGRELDPLFASAAEAMMGQCLGEHGRFADALAAGARAHAPFRQPRAAEPSALWLAASRYGYILQMAGDFTHSDRIIRDAQVVMTAARIARNSDQQSGERMLALNDLYRGRHATADAMFRDLISLDTSPTRRFASQSNFARLGLTESLIDQDRLAEAETEIAALADVVQRIAADEIAISRPFVSQYERLRGWLALKRGDPADAAARFRAVIALILPRQHADSPHLARARADLALALAKGGERSEARALASAARQAITRHAQAGPQYSKSLIAVEKLLGR